MRVWTNRSTRSIRSCALIGVAVCWRGDYLESSIIAFASVPGLSHRERSGRPRAAATSASMLSWRRASRPAQSLRRTGLYPYHRRYDRRRTLGPEWAEILLRILAATRASPANSSFFQASTMSCRRPAANPARLRSAVQTLRKRCADAALSAMAAFGADPFALMKDGAIRARRPLAREP